MEYRMPEPPVPPIRIYEHRLFGKVRLTKESDEAEIRYQAARDEWERIRDHFVWEEVRAVVSSPASPPEPSPPVGLTVREKNALSHLANAWNEFARLDGSHPADRREFQAAIHAAQNILACRVAKRVDPDQWWQDKEER